MGAFSLIVVINLLNRKAMRKKGKGKRDEGSMLLAQAMLPQTLIAATPEVSAEQFNANPIHMAIINAGQMAASLNFIQHKSRSRSGSRPQSAIGGARAMSQSYSQYEDVENGYVGEQNESEASENEVNDQSDIEGSVNIS